MSYGQGYLPNVGSGSGSGLTPSQTALLLKLAGDGASDEEVWKWDGSNADWQTDTSLTSAQATLLGKLGGTGASDDEVWKYDGTDGNWGKDAEGNKWTIGKDLPASPEANQRHTFTLEGTHKLPVQSLSKTGQAGFAFFSNVATSVIYSNSGAGVGGTRSFVMGYNSGDDVSGYTSMVSGDELWVVDTTDGSITKLILTAAPGTATYGSGGNNRPGVYWATANLQSPPASNWMTAGRQYNIVAVKAYQSLSI